MIRHRLVYGLQVKLALVLLLGALAVAAPTLAPTPAAARPDPGGNACDDYYGNHPEISQGVYNSEDVRHAQCLLNASFGYDRLAVDGDFGPQTDQAVRDFQSQSYLYDDGIIGWCTWEMLHDRPPDAYSGCYDS